MQFQALNAYNRTRALFARGFKSANKKYASPSAVGMRKFQRRQTNHLVASAYMAQGADRSQTYRDKQLGESLIAQGATASGNCLEMSRVALAYLRQQSLEIPAHIVWITHPGDHVFLHVGPVPLMPDYRLPANVWTLCAITPLNVEGYVVDPWAGICCHATTYRIHFASKMQKWNSRRKEIYGNTGWVRPDAAYVTANMDSGQLIWWPC